jgi:hypothetical protein
MRTSLLVLTLALALVAAGCGGTKSPSVADVGTNHTNTSSSSTASPPAGGTSSGSGGNASMVMKLANGAKFAACMRKNGVPNFPDPSHDGSIQFGPGSGIDPNSPKFRAAQAKCEKEIPHGPPPTAAQQQKMQQAALAFSKCMRAHGVTKFPDPQFSGGRTSLQIKGSPGSGLDPNSPTFKRAQQACQGRLPKLAGGVGTATSSGGK